MAKNMTDLELLELAAKAAGLTIIGSMPSLLSPDDWLETTSNGPDMFWNPLTNDGDALRLAVKLRLGIEINDGSVIACWVNGGYETKVVYEYPESVQNEDFDIVQVNHDKATRRAIVRAAAEIGRNMK